MEFAVDRDLPVPLHAQLQGLIEYGIVCGELAAGEALPSVRDMAERAGIAPMTVSQVYGDLKKAGLIETRPGSGCFVAANGRARLASRPEAVELHRRIDALLDAAAAAGVRPGELVSMVGARAFHRDSIGPRLRVVMVGLFAEATASYARAIAARLGPGVTVEPVTVSALEREPSARARANSADLAVTFVNRQRDVASLVPNTKVVSISFIPAEETRRSLAALDPLARAAVVSRFPDFLPIMKAGVRRFAPHVAQVGAGVLGASTLPDLLDRADVVVFASGADEVAAGLAPGTAAIEYRHAPDAGEIERVLVPLLRGAEGLPADRSAATAQRRAAL